MKSMPANLRRICNGERTDLSPEQLAAYDVICRQYCLEDVEGPYCQQVIQLTPPPLMIRGWNFATAMARWAIHGMPRRSQSEIDDRLAICQSCEFLNDNHCTKCGCVCVEQNRLINKLALATEKCPEGKWQ